MEGRGSHGYFRIKEPVPTAVGTGSCSVDGEYLEHLLGVFGGYRADSSKYE